MIESTCAICTVEKRECTEKIRAKKFLQEQTERVVPQDAKLELGNTLSGERISDPLIEGSVLESMIHLYWRRR